MTRRHQAVTAKTWPLWFALASCVHAATPNTLPAALDAGVETDAGAPPQVIQQTVKPPPNPLGLALANVLLPPSTFGTHRSAVEGCAANPQAADQPATRLGLPVNEIAAQPASGGAIVAHEFTHTCCLGATSSAKVEGTKVIITEVLSGTACKCQCTSNIKTAVGLKTGVWQVEVRTSSPMKTWPVQQREVRVP
jgi:hypothetical protein